MSSRPSSATIIATPSGWCDVGLARPADLVAVRVARRPRRRARSSVGARLRVARADRRRAAAASAAVDAAAVCRRGSAAHRSTVVTPSGRLLDSYVTKRRERRSRRAAPGRRGTRARCTKPSPTTSPPSRSTSRDRRRRGAAGGEHVVDDQHPLARRDRVAVDLEQVGAVLELVLLALDLPRQLARLAHRARTRPCSGRRPAPRR